MNQPTSQCNYLILLLTTINIHLISFVHIIYHNIPFTIWKQSTSDPTMAIRHEQTDPTMAMTGHGNDTMGTPVAATCLVPGAVASRRKVSASQPLEVVGHGLCPQAMVRDWWWIHIFNPDWYLMVNYRLFTVIKAGGGLWSRSAILEFNGHGLKWRINNEQWISCGQWTGISENNVKLSLNWFVSCFIPD